MGATQIRINTVGGRTWLSVLSPGLDRPDGSKYHANLACEVRETVFGRRANVVRIDSVFAQVPGGREIVNGSKAPEPGDGMNETAEMVALGHKAMDLEGFFERKAAAIGWQHQDLSDYYRKWLMVFNFMPYLDSFRDRHLTRKGIWDCPDAAELIKALKDCRDLKGQSAVYRARLGRKLIEQSDDAEEISPDLQRAIVYRGLFRFPHEWGTEQVDTKTLHAALDAYAAWFCGGTRELASGKRKNRNVAAWHRRFKDFQSNSYPDLLPSRFPGADQSLKRRQIMFQLLLSSLPYAANSYEYVSSKFLDVLHDEQLLDQDGLKQFGYLHTRQDAFGGYPPAMLMNPPRQMSKRGRVPPKQPKARPDPTLCFSPAIELLRLGAPDQCWTAAEVRFVFSVYSALHDVIAEHECDKRQRERSPEMAVDFERTELDNERFMGDYASRDDDDL